MNNIDKNRFDKHYQQLLKCLFIVMLGYNITYLF